MMSTLSLGQSLLVYLLSVPIFFAIDMLWLGVIARNLYQNSLGHLLAPSVNWPVAITFYLLFLVGLSVFVIVPALTEQNILHALLYGALFGFFTYATYDLTNWATLAGWPWKIALIDMLWGTVLSASVAGITYSLANIFIVR